MNTKRCFVILTCLFVLTTTDVKVYAGSITNEMSPLVEEVGKMLDNNIWL